MKKKLKSLFFILLLAFSPIYILADNINGYYIPKSFKNEKHDLTILGFILYSDGIGRIAPELLDVLKDDIKVNLIQTKKTNLNQIPKRLRPYISYGKDLWGKVILYIDWLQGFKENTFDSYSKGSIKIAYSMWESNQIPDEWVHRLNTHFDAVVVPAPFLIEVYKNCGVKIPVFEIPIGLDIKHLLKEPLKKERGYPLVFGNLSTCCDRKNQLIIIQAFAKAFNNDPNVFLRLNGRSADKKFFNDLKKTIANLNLTNVLLTSSTLPLEEYLKEIKNIDCYVSPSKGEGFSIQPREAMALGIPVIATNNTAQKVICESGLVKSVESPILEPAIYPWGTVYGEHYNCEVDDLASAMIEVKENYDTYLEKGEKAREWASQYQYKHLKNIYRNLVKPKHILKGIENIVTEDYIITDSDKLYQKYINLFGKEIAN